MLYSSLAGGVGGLLGLAGYYFTTKRSTAFRVVVLIILGAVMVLPVFLSPVSATATNENGQAYATCPVCGYIAYNPQEKVCDNCGEELTEQELRDAGMSSIDSLVRPDQLYYFIPDDEKAAVSFKQPAVSEDGYKLDESWQPSVSIAAVEKQAVQYYEFRRKYPVKVKVIKKERK